MLSKTIFIYLKIKMCVFDYNLKKYVLLTDFYKKIVHLIIIWKKMYEIKILLNYYTYLL